MCFFPESLAGILVFCFVIFFFRIDVPNGGFIRVLSNGMADGFDGCQHGMVHIVITVLPVASDTIQVFNLG